MLDLPPSLKIDFNRKSHLHILSQPKTKRLVSLQLINKVQLLLLVQQGRTSENVSSFSFYFFLFVCFFVNCENRFPCIFASYKTKFRSTLAQRFSQAWHRHSKELLGAEVANTSSMVNIFMAEQLCGPSLPHHSLQTRKKITQKPLQKYWLEYFLLFLLFVAMMLKGKKEFGHHIKKDEWQPQRLHRGKYHTAIRNPFSGSCQCLPQQWLLLCCPRRAHLSCHESLHCSSQKTENDCKQQKSPSDPEIFQGDRKHISIHQEDKT